MRQRALDGRVRDRPAVAAAPLGKRRRAALRRAGRPPPGPRRPDRSAAARAEATPARVAALEERRLGSSGCWGAATAVGRVGHRHRAAGTRRDVERELPLVVSRRAPVACGSTFPRSCCGRPIMPPATGRPVGCSGVLLRPAGERRRLAALLRRLGRRLTGRRYAGLLSAEPSGTNSPSFVIGSLYFLRRNRFSTRKSMLGGKAFGMFAFLNLKRAIARAYCSPRKTSSASFSRCASWRQTGIAIDQQDRHDRERDQQRRHRVSALTSS